MISRSYFNVTMAEGKKKKFFTNKGMKMEGDDVIKSTGVQR